MLKLFNKHSCLISVLSFYIDLLLTSVKSMLFNAYVINMLGYLSMNPMMY